jgi:FkbM family methyltransferase
MGSLGHIYCFEPVPLLYECLEKNVKANSISCITLIPLALSDSPGKLKLDIQGGELGMSRIVEENQLNSLQNSIEVNVTTFDLWMKDSGIAQVAVVKIDVEDHELEVLKGMEDSLSKHHIGSIVFERHKDCDTTDAVVQLLQRHGYKIFRIYKGLLKTEVVELGCSANFKKTSDYVAVIENSEFERRLLSSPTVRATAKLREF